LTWSRQSNIKTIVANKPHSYPTLKLFGPKLSGGYGWKWLGCAGWLIAGVLGFWAVPRIYHHFTDGFPALYRGYIGPAVANKKRALLSPWQDRRPLIILAGDSHIEFGNWYDLFGGARAVRNCGLAGAQVADVTELVSAITDLHPQMIVLMCGVNNFLHGQTGPDQCLKDYELLLATIRARLQPGSILVLSLMPLRESPSERSVHQLNAAINQFNLRLSAFCREHQVVFLDVNPAVSDANGSLAPELTADGLHLNLDGYQRLAAAIAPHLPTPPTP
jgi:lysophospholipase L1-like esterase